MKTTDSAFGGKSGMNKRNFSFMKSSIVVLVILLIISSGSGFYFYRKATTDPQKVEKNDLEDTVQAVGKLIVLPTNETPTLATVTDPAKLQNQIFFSRATKGDKVLIYAVAGKAILYNPTLNKIVEVSSISIPK